MRRPLPGQFSVEQVFADVAGALPPDIDVRVVQVPHQSLGVLPRLRNALFAARLQADVVHVAGDIQYCALAVRKGKCVLTVLDLGNLRHLKGWRRLVFEVLWYRLPVRRSAIVTTISYFVRDELLDLIPEVADRLVVIGCPVSDFFAPPAVSAGGGEFQVLLVGTIRTKNLDRVAQALRGLPVQVEIVGELCDVERRRFDECAVSYTSAAGLTRDQVLDAYHRADLLVFASTHEGFGLPILEAQACGVPVVTSDLPPMAAVAGGAAVLVDPFDVASIREGVQTVLNDPARRATLVEAGLRNVRRYSPAHVASLYAGTYRQVAQDAP